MNTAYIALGTNIEPRENYLKDALRYLKNDHVTIQQQSSIYETAPVGYTDQASFLNMVIQLKTELSPLQLLEFCQYIEKELGRKRTIRFGPRTIDLDILLYNNEIINGERLIIPHPRMHERAFVLVPLHEIAPACIIPNKERNAEELLSELPRSDIKDVMIWTQNASEEE
ncbi:2-amino-4-hydroxy-6-hydroxymethyldihydropteridine diphosphokinase [Virgibacillus kimchii]